MNRVDWVSRAFATRTAGVVLATVLLGTAAAAQAPPKPLPALPNLQLPIGVPQQSTPMNDPIIFYLQLRDPGDATRGRPQKVSVDYVKSAQQVGEDNIAYAARLTREKAKAIADATNALVANTAKAIEKDVDVIVGWRTDALGRPLRDAFGRFVPIVKKFKQGYVEFTNVVNDPRLKKDEQLRGQQFSFGERVKQPNGGFKVVGANPTGEPGGAAWGQGVIPNIPPPTGGGTGKSMGSMGGASGLGTGLSIGDFPGDSELGSYAAFGIYDLDNAGNPIFDSAGGLPVAVVGIRPGETGSEVLLELLSLLLTMDLDAFYDPAEDTLVIQNVGTNQMVFWNETDTGLEFSQGAAFEIWMPATLSLLGLGLPLVAWLRRPRP